MLRDCLANQTCIETVRTSNVVGVRGSTRVSQSFYCVTCTVLVELADVAPGVVGDGLGDLAASAKAEKYGCQDHQEVINMPWYQ